MHKITASMCKCNWNTWEKLSSSAVLYLLTSPVFYNDKKFVTSTGVFTCSTMHMWMISEQLATATCMYTTSLNTKGDTLCTVNYE